MYVLLLLLPSTVFTVIVAVPSTLAVTAPVSETVVTEVLSLDQVTVLFVALAGKTVAVNCCVTNR
jgi:hypothetical protein